MTHGLRRYGEEVRTILPLNIFLIYQPQVCFVDERGGLQRMARALTIHMALRHPPQFLINQRHQLVEGILISASPGAEQLAYILWRWPCGLHWFGFLSVISPHRVPKSIAKIFRDH